MNAIGMKQALDTALRDVARKFVAGCMPGLLREMRRLDLRAQAHRKGRPNWRHMSILPMRCIRFAERNAEGS